MLMLTLVPACSNSMQRAAEYASIADGQLAEGNLEDARENVRRAIAERDDVAEYYILLGRIELQAERLTSAFNAYSMALDLQADNPEILINIAELGLQTGRTREADEAADRLLLLEPGATRAMLVKGFVAIDDGRLDDAQKTASEILALNARDEGGIILSVRVDALRGKSREALQAINAAIAENGATNALNVTRLEVYRMLGDADGMRAIFPDILKAVGDDIDYRLDFINLLYKTGDASTARAEAVKAIQASPNDAQLFRKLTALWLEYDRKPLSKAQIDYLAASGARVSQLSLARFYYTIGGYDAATQLISRMSAEGVMDARALMSRILLGRGDSRKAYALADDLLRSDPRNEDALLVRSARHLAAGNIDRAIEDANIVVSDAPENYSGYVQLAQAYVAKGNAIRARQTFERGMDSLPQSRELADAYQKFLLRSDDVARVVTLDEDVALAKPSSVAAWAAFARSCAAYGDALCARKAEAGIARAKSSYLVDEPPGTPRRRGLFARITPEQICTSVGGICTES